MRHTAIRILLAVAGVWASAGALSAQSYALQVHVPFDFHAAQQTLPAGDYLVYKPTNLNAQLIRPLHRGPQLALKAGGMTLSGNEPTSVVFRCYEGSCFISQIWDGVGNGADFAVSKEEKIARERLTAGKQDTVKILAQLH